MRRISLFVMLVLLACSGSGPSAREEATQQAGSPAPTQGLAPKFYREGLQGVDFSGLDAIQKERALQILNSNLCDCGRGMTIAQCRVEDPKCSRSLVLAGVVVSAVRAGKNDQQVVAELKAQSNPAASGAPPQPAQPLPKITINTAGSPSLGPDTAKVSVVAFSDFQ